jgi:hypothetical protein
MTFVRNDKKGQYYFDIFQTKKQPLITKDCFF